MLAGEAAARTEPNPFPASLLSSKHWTLAASFAGNDNVLARCERELREMAEFTGANNAEMVDQKHLASVFGRQREFVPIALESSPATTVVKMSVLPSRMAEVLELAGEGGVDENAFVMGGLWRRGVGVIYFALLPAEMTAQTLNQVAQATSKILAGCASLGGSATIPWCPGEWKLALNIWGPNRGDFDLMRKLKNLFDPGDVLSPGRFAGGM